MQNIFSGNGAIEPSMISIPPIEHWAPVHVMPMQGETTYRWIFVSTKDDVRNIRMTTTGFTQKMSDIASTYYDVTPHSGGKIFLLDSIVYFLT